METVPFSYIAVESLTVICIKAIVSIANPGGSCGRAAGTEQLTFIYFATAPSLFYSREAMSQVAVIARILDLEE